MTDSRRVAAYLDRIGYAGPVEVSLETLRGMHRAHFLRVPFENLSIQRGETITVDPAHNYEKIVTRRRGGFCLELSGLFAWCLREIGFEVDLLGARVMSATGAISEPHSHMALLVHLDEPWIADVGFGGAVAEPLLLAERAPQVAGRRSYVVANDGDHWLVTCTEPWQAEGASTYLFTLQPRTYEGFEPVCHWLQTSPDSHFTAGDVVSLPLEEGRLTYAGGRLITTTDAGREETEVTPDALAGVLRAKFGIEW
jgi:N-hydroxyarylamine O-acetyltransferase